MRARILRKSYPAETGAVRQIRLEVAEIAASLARLEDVVERVRLAVSEAAANVVQHAYEEGRGEIHVTVSLPEHGRLAVIVADDGEWLAAPRESIGLGLGMLVMRSCADGLQVQRSRSGGVGVHMSFVLNAPRESDGTGTRRLAAGARAPRREGPLRAGASR